MGIEDIRDALIIREGATGLITDRAGNIPEGNTQGLGLYHADTRHLSTYTLTVNGVSPVVLLSTAELGYAMEQVMTNPVITMQEGRRIGQSSVEIRRQRVISDLVEEHLRITNFNPFPITLELLYECAADFADIFDVRGFEREAWEERRTTEVGERAITYAYTGVDGRERRTRIEFDRAPARIDSKQALFLVTLERRETIIMRTSIALGADPPPASEQDDRIAGLAQSYREWLDGSTQIFTDNEFFNRVMSRSLQDIRMLSSMTEDGDRFTAAGAPWYDALFGRDSCIVAMQMLAYRPEIAAQTLRVLAKWQGTHIDHARDEEPGKILHELRFDELTLAGKLPYRPYYGTIDATPLFLMLAAHYWEWTGDLDFMREMLPAMKAAIRWMDDSVDARGDGYLSYEKRSDKGLVNQGWKDSWDAVVHINGTLANPPIALAEVQAYAYFARTHLAPVLMRLDEVELAERLMTEAARLKERFNDDFWMPDRRFYALALDGDGKQVESATSNPAHGLWSGIIDPDHADATVSRLMENDMFSGWGIRTLSGGNPRFNPIGYHLGSVWPHDNSIAAMGFKMYGYEDELNEVATALFEAAASFPNFRLPELFGGEMRSAHQSPVPYPVACRPQAWAAGTFPLMTQAILGLRPEAFKNRLRIVNPRLPYWLNTVQVRNLRVGQGRLTLQYHREGNATRVEIQEATNDIDVVISSRWPVL
ncbi:MAG TPA: amylo-alpha-1,6-glucosidase [Dehalococcoidia bacterium]|nr:amylo-alpha-1,6-glucosidase [Dehalococcoidia bacterium]